MSKEDQLFQGWVEENAAKLAGPQLEAFKVFAQTEMARDVFRGSLREKDYYTRLNELNSQKQAALTAQQEAEELRSRLEQWYEEEAPKNEQLIAERDALRQQVEELGSGGPPPASGSGLTISSEDLAELKAKAAKVETLDKLIPAVLGDMSAVLKDSIKNGFEVDPREVIRVSLQQGIEPYRAYEALTREEREKRYEKAREDERKKWIEEGRRQALTNSPDHIQPSGPNVVTYLQGLSKGEAQAPDQTSRVGAALKEFVGGNWSLDA